MTISIISAVAENGVIGNKNGLPWCLPADFKYFKEKTLGKTIILGYNTFKSIGEKPLPNRKHIVLSNDPNLKLAESFGTAQDRDCYLATSINEALKIARNISGNIDARRPSNLMIEVTKNIDVGRLYNSIENNEEVMVCGGAMVYRQFLPLADKLYLTEIHHSFEGDTYFPEFNKNEWQEVSREDHQPDPLSPEASEGRGGNRYAYSFVVLERKK